MRQYYIYENLTTKNGKYIAVNKAREDVYEIMKEMGYECIYVTAKSNQERKKLNFRDKILEHNRIAKSWDTSIKDAIIDPNDSFIWIQFPPSNHSLKLYSIIKKYHKKGVKIGLIIHDINMLRYSTRGKGNIKRTVKTKFEEWPMLAIADYIIAHNKAMIDSLVNMGIRRNKLFDLQIFDYLMNPTIKAKVRLENPIILAGNLHSDKAGYVYNLPGDVSFNLYGVNYENQNRDSIEYKGSFPSNELPEKLVGSFGLIWDGPSSETCSGPFGSYLRINNPHKTSLYLASGLPVIIWKHAALAPFVEENHCGVLIESLRDISTELKRISQTDYDTMLQNVQKIRELLIKGYYTRKILTEITDTIGKTD